MKGLPNFQLINGRWRGIMPFRRDKAVVKLYEQQRRAGEPSPFTDSASGMAEGSYTEKMRKALIEWSDANLVGGWIGGDLTFEYKLYRHKIVTVIATLPVIRHHPFYGHGKRGFILMCHVKSIDGLPVKSPWKNVFVWDRIVAKERFLSLPPKKELLK
jgi:hypothetical protein